MAAPACVVGSVGIAAACPSPTALEGPLVSVPFELVRNQIVLEVLLGEHGPYNMLLDTAVDPSAVDLATAEAAGLPVDRGRAGEASGTGSDRVTVYAAGISRLSIADVEFEAIPALAVDLSTLGDRLGRPLHGVLGYSFLRSRAVRIDYPGRTVHIYDSAIDEDPPAGGVAFPMVLEGTDILIEGFRVNGQPLRVSLDTGSSLTLEIYDHAAERLGLDPLTEGAEEGTVVGARGEAEYPRSLARAINAHDLVVGVSVPQTVGADFEGRATMWRGQVPFDLGTLPGGTNSSAFAVNDAGVIAGWSDVVIDGVTEYRAVLWIP